MWQDALKRCGLPVDDGELFEIWLNGSEANGAGEPETATETADGVELTWIEAGLELRARISTDAETGMVRLSGGIKNVVGTPVTLTRANWRFTLAERQYSLYTQAGGWMVARKLRRLAQLQRGRNGDKQRMGAHHAVCGAVHGAARRKLRAHDRDAPDTLWRLAHVFAKPLRQQGLPQDRRKRAAVRGVKAGRRLIGEMDLVISTYCMEWIKINSNLILNPG